MKKGGKKKTKEELEAERLIAEEEERVRLEEEAKRLAEEEALRLEREEQERLERERLRREELERLNEEASTTKPLVERRARYRKSHILAESKAKDWRAFLACSPLPQQDSDADINTYLKAMVLEENSDMESILAQCEVLHNVSQILGASLTKHLGKGEFELTAATRDNARKVLATEVSRIDRGTANLLVRADEFVSPKQEVLLGHYSKNFGVGIWINMASKGFRMRIIDFPGLSIIAEIPKTLALQSVAVRVVHLLDDVLSRPNSKDDLEFETAKGGLVFFETLKLPPSTKSTKGWTMRPINPAVENRVLRVSFNASEGGAPGAVPSSPDPSGGNGPIAVALKVKIAKTVLIRNTNGEHQPLIVEEAEQDLEEEGDGENRMPDALAVAQQQAQNAYAEGVSVRVGAWDNTLGTWSEDGVSDVSFDPQSRVLSFTSIRNTAHAIIQRRDVDHPFRFWSLQPLFHDAANISNNAASGTQDEDAEDDEADPFEPTSAEGDPTNPSAPKVVGAMLTLRCPSWVVKIEIYGSSRCRLVEPREQELAHLIGVEKTPADLFSELAACGIDLRSPLESSAVPAGTCVLGNDIKLKVDRLERHVYEEMSAAVSSSFAISTSRWNQKIDHEKCCVTLQEAYESADSGLDLDAMLRQELGEDAPVAGETSDGGPPADGAEAVAGSGEDQPDGGQAEVSEGAVDEEKKEAENVEEKKDPEPEKPAEAPAGKKGKKGKKDKKKDKEEQARLEAEAAAAAAEAAAREAEEAAAALIEPDPIPSEPRVVLFQTDAEVQDTGIKCSFLKMREDDEELDTVTISKDQTTHVYLENALLAAGIYCQDRIHNMQDNPATTGLREALQELSCDIPVPDKTNAPSSNCGGPGAIAAGATAAMEDLRELLRSLDGTQEDIERIAGKAIALDKDGGDVDGFVKMVRENGSDALVYMYVANDIVQKCRGSKLWAAFKSALPSAIEEIKEDASNRPKFIRILNIWAQRKIFDSGTIMALKKRLSQASLNTEFGELPEFRTRGSSGAGDHYDSNDEDEDDYQKDSDRENEDDDDGENKGASGDGTSQRESSISAIQRVPVSRLMSAFRRANEVAKETSTSVLDLAESSVKALRERAGDGSPETETKRLQAALEALPDSVLFDIQDTTMTALQKLVASRDSVRRAGLLASALVMNVEAQMESVGKSMNDAEGQLDTIKAVEDRVRHLEDEQKKKGTAGKVEATVVTLRRNLKASARKKRARMNSDEAASSDDDESGSEYEDVDDEDDKHANGGQDDPSGDAKISMLGIRKRKRRKKKKTEATTEERVPMIWNKQLNMYVPMPSNQEEEDWRN
ncbi:Protein CASC1 [Hondaea fermentalgiana]|uniref:Protein CASC1 n=1 Tax=Hondaea fermentalgiana TaxID=2315210 RepID=A0A2R5GJ54_9STRA|nr:Protein CASC1 [Hondaea fermentalgiana]|eukprot:GBG28683.1 Protein CASC1 [Hondaea fermentalgiana]